MCRTVHAKSARWDAEAAASVLRRQAARHAESALRLQQAALMATEDYYEGVLAPEIERHASEAADLTAKATAIIMNFRPRCGRCNRIHLSDAAAQACSRREDQ